jgi:nucleoside diphosphate kinase
VERTLILVKPDAFDRNLSGEIIARFERKGLRLVALQLMTMSRELARTGSMAPTVPSRQRVRWACSSLI